MKYCKNCDLKIDGLQETCLFCGSKLEEIDNMCHIFASIVDVNTNYNIKKIDYTKSIFLLILINS